MPAITFLHAPDPAILSAATARTTRWVGTMLRTGARMRCLERWRGMQVSLGGVVSELFGFNRDRLTAVHGKIWPPDKL